MGNDRKKGAQLHVSCHVIKFICCFGWRVSKIKANLNDSNFMIKLFDWLFDRNSMGIVKVKYLVFYNSCLAS